jgi:hypothetical protein
MSKKYINMKEITEEDYKKFIKEYKEIIIENTRIKTYVDDARNLNLIEDEKHESYYMIKSE